MFTEHSRFDNDELAAATVSTTASIALGLAAAEAAAPEAIAHGPDPEENGIARSHRRERGTS